MRASPAFCVEVCLSAHSSVPSLSLCPVFTVTFSSENVTDYTLSSAQMSRSIAMGLIYKALPREGRGQSDLGFSDFCLPAPEGMQAAHLTISVCTHTLTCHSGILTPKIKWTEITAQFLTQNQTTSYPWTFPRTPVSVFLPKFTGHRPHSAWHRTINKWPGQLNIVSLPKILIQDLN